MMLNCLIVDDEPLARQQIETYVNRVPFLKLVGSVRNPAIAKEVLKDELVDLIFLDIKMPQMSGIDFLKSQQIFQQVIFVTAYPEYAIEGFELEVTDYLMKPVTFERFLRASEKALAKVSGSSTIKSIQSQPDSLYVKCNQRLEKISIDDILFIESMLNYINIITKTGKYVVYSSLKAIEIKLPPEKFTRIHKSYLAAIHHITAIGHHQLAIGEHILPVSRSNKQHLLQATLQLGLNVTI
ncbi:LytTR family two component transcriptional regulator [Mucilaginibacter frigoritolerans]|jgi:DNA-binding LytR/AlgR family response regulator|uniref:LytTR family two component transcriptional regulator n=1 Tax=Mucilaginibacter frigoritolerans TaxID=652788 RepID=A0A562TQT7_9SPHI|nr:LytTR family DNA-binding domain-containing protein [Mucilaginibacter frigoritolerans]TWI95554.1 LytTR family two component transcriptional regulator [Mucilaginibacter frigoritolerans]